MNFPPFELLIVTCAEQLFQKSWQLFECNRSICQTWMNICVVVCLTVCAYTFFLLSQISLSYFLVQSHEVDFEECMVDDSLSLLGHQIGILQ